MYLEACLQQRRHFSPFVALVDGLLGVEATANLKRLASCLATKWKQSYSKMCGYVKSTIAITLVGTTHGCIRASAPVGGWRRAKPLQASTLGLPQPTHSHKHLIPSHTPAHHCQPPKVEQVDNNTRAPQRQRRGDRVHRSHH